MTKEIKIGDKQITFTANGATALYYKQFFHKDLMKLISSDDGASMELATDNIPEMLEMVKEIVKNGYGYETSKGIYFDTSKLAINTLNIGLAGIEVYTLLRDKYNIQLEFGDTANILALSSICDREEDNVMLLEALKDIKNK